MKYEIWDTDTWLDGRTRDLVRWWCAGSDILAGWGEPGDQVRAKQTALGVDSFTTARATTSHQAGKAHCCHQSKNHVINLIKVNAWRNQERFIVMKTAWDIFFRILRKTVGKK